MPTICPVAAWSLRALLFTDIEGSTTLLRQLGERYEVVLDRHCTIILAAAAGWSGVEQGREGDSLFITFPSATAALACALEAQLGIEQEPWPAGGRVRVRMGLHVGEVADSPAGLVGLAIHQAARISNAAHGGQIVISGDVVEQVAGLPSDSTIRPLGSYVLRDVGQVSLYQLNHPDLQDSFPALRTKRAVSHNLPATLTTFVGRVVERAELVTVVRSHRLVTAAGPGGVGKTRLAVAAAQDLIDEFEDGAVFVDLVKVTRPEMVVAAIAAAADVPETSGATLDESLIASLADRRCLLVVDNCEHLQDAARVWIERLLSGCPSLHILATSRLRLMLPFERVFAVPGLSLDATSGVSDAEALFVERMNDAGADAHDGAADRAIIGVICTALEGSALGIELAAARAPSLGLEALASALGTHFEILDIGARAEERHRSLRAAIDWSYQLLVPEEQAMLRAAATFAAPADLAAVCAVSRRPSRAVVDVLARLVDWNLVALKAGSVARYRVLETIRQYAVDAAESIGEADILRGAHLEWCQARLDDLYARAPGDEAWCAEVDSVVDEARAALAWADQGGTAPPWRSRWPAFSPTSSSSVVSPPRRSAVTSKRRP